MLMANHRPTLGQHLAEISGFRYLIDLFEIRLSSATIVLRSGRCSANGRPSGGQRGIFQGMWA
jgi:hypothetical protein